MSKLTCNVSTCSSNSNMCCCRPSINVHGENAKSKSDTICKSFVPKTNSMTNSTQYSSPNEYLDISCSASDCKHHSNGKCNAESINVSGVNAQEMAHTQCSSFESKCCGSCDGSCH